MLIIIINTIFKEVYNYYYYSAVGAIIHKVFPSPL